MANLGIYPNVKAYHDDGSKFNNGMGKRLSEETCSLYEAFNPKPVASSSVLFGSLYHTMMELGFDAFHVSPAKKRQGSTWERDYVTGISEDLTPITTPELLKLEEMWEVFKMMAPKQIREDQEKGEHEVCFTTDTKRILVDCLGLKLDDWKTTLSVEPHAIKQTIAKYKYHIQAAFYKDVYKEVTGEDKDFCFVFQSTTEPYEVVPVQLDERSEESGRIMYQRAYERWLRWKDEPKENLLGYSEGKILTITVPEFAQAQKSAAQVFTEE